MKKLKELIDQRDFSTPELLEQGVKNYKGFVRSIANNIYATTISGEYLEDLIAIGNMGLLEAMQRFDPTQGNKFTTYAYRRVRGSILDHIRKIGNVPRQQIQKKKIVNKKVSDLINKLGREPTHIELHNEIGAENIYTNYLLNNAYTANYVEIEEYNNNVPPELTSEDTFDIVYGYEKLNTVLSVIDSLRARDGYIIHAHYFMGQTFTAIATTLDVTPCYISILHKKIIAELKITLADTEYFSMFG